MQVAVAVKVNTLPGEPVAWHCLRAVENLETSDGVSNATTFEISTFLIGVDFLLQWNVCIM